MHQADDTHSTEWEDVLYKHEDIVTGSYQKTTADGTLAGGTDPPARVEFEPLGGAIPDGDPYIADEGFDPRPLRDFSFAGDVNSPEFGCTWDGMPFSCGLLSVVLHGQGSFRIDVNTRMSGGWEAYNVLQGAYSIVQRQIPVTNKTNVCIGEGCTPDGPPDVSSGYRTVYSLIQAPFSFDSFNRSHGPSADFNDIAPQLPEDCPPVPTWPSDANLDANIELAKKNGMASWWNPVKPAYDLKAAVWFRDQVKNKGPWDYKQKGNQYQDFGNFNYGATGLALGFDELTLLREAGRAQQAAGTSKKEWGEPGDRLNPWGGSGSYGDDPDDQEQIKKGFAYYYAKQKGCTWKK